MMDNVFGNYRVAISKTTGSSNPAYHARSAVGSEWDYIVKVCATNPLHSPEEEEVFRQYIVGLNQLKSPHILSIEDYGFKKNIPFYVTRYLTKGSLRECLAQVSLNPLSIQEIIMIIVQIGETLQYAHEHHIIHGNIKPENILFDTNNDAQLVDFYLPENIAGINSAYRDKRQCSYYPEHEALNEKSDQYALACLAYELFSKMLPVIQDGLSVSSHDTIEEVPTLAFSRSTSEVLRQIKTRLVKAMAKEPEKRYENVAAFVAALNEVSAAQFVITVPEAIFFAPITPAPVTVDKFFQSEKALPGSALLAQWRQYTFINGNFTHRLLFIAAIVLLLCFLLSGSVWQFYAGETMRQTTASPASTEQGLSGTSIILTPQAINPIQQPVLTATPDVPTHVASPRPTATPLPIVKPSLPTAIVTSPPQVSTPSSTLLGHWKFDQGSGSIASDSSGNGYTGILQGNATWGPPHGGSSALSLDGSYGTNVDISGPVVNTAQSFSVAAWVKVSEFNGNFQTFVSIDGNQVSGFYLQWQPDTRKFSFTRLSNDGTNAGRSVTVALSFPQTDTWYNLVGVYDAGAQTIALYVNGNLQQTVHDPNVWQADGHTEIGCALYNGRHVDFVVGEIDSVYIYKGVLTASNIASLVAAG